MPITITMTTSTLIMITFTAESGLAGLHLSTSPDHKPVYEHVLVSNILGKTDEF